MIGYCNILLYIQYYIIIFWGIDIGYRDSSIYHMQYDVQRLIAWHLLLSHIEDASEWQKHSQEAPVSLAVAESYINELTQFELVLKSSCAGFNR
jgi:hypothetical protein